MLIVGAQPLDPVPRRRTCRIRCRLIVLLKHHTRTNRRPAPNALLAPQPPSFNQTRSRTGQAGGPHVFSSPSDGNGRLAAGVIHSHGNFAGHLGAERLSMHYKHSASVSCPLRSAASSRSTAMKCSKGAQRLHATCTASLMPPFVFEGDGSPPFHR